MHSLLCSGNVYLRFVELFAHVAPPLNVVLDYGVSESFELNKELKAAFRKLFDVVTSQPVLVLPVTRLLKSINKDTSAYQVGCTLFQAH